MDFSYSDEQRMLKDMVDRVVADQYSFEQREKIIKSDTGYSPEVWSQFAELGLLAVPFSEAAGGFNGGGAELMVVAEGFGRGLVVEPYLSTVVLAGTFLDAALGDDAKADALEPIISGEQKYALACYEPNGRYDPFWIETTAKKDGDSYVLSGKKAVVLGGDSADRLLVIARSSGDNPGKNGLSAFLVDGNADGVSRDGYTTFDGHRAAEIVLDNVKVGADALVGEEGGAAAPLQYALDRGIIALCAEAAGAMEVACDLTLDYIKERKQFGVPIGSFQALQHRMVDMRISLEKVRSLALWAACSLDAPDAERRQRLAAAKAMVSKAGRHVAEEAIQLFGGMGMMDESSISHYAKRIVLIDHYLGDGNYHTDRLIDLLVEENAAA
ncbi:acyl-CoA dehydrogenase [Salinisphaera shabanensis T35B1]|uniref:Isoquinoline 1-oxidoreductase protein n=1 Tax=Salinisphaera shabanensis E1L3A TaxID=1033802 RepID=U2E6F9_9GAMM|nr:acyl-CoA dehydrogenase [Salinisphaera shabanensis]ERJ19356.1 isoquinoline 1-oxidoreductase protein [Salinisphaera shabanensis E1L3A]